MRGRLLGSAGLALFAAADVQAQTTTLPPIGRHGAEPDPPCRARAARRNARASPGGAGRNHRHARRAAARCAADRHRPVRDRDGRPERRAAAHARAARSAIFCSPSPASPARASRRAQRPGRSSAASTSIASASWRTASAPAACPISARIISCRSIRSRLNQVEVIRGPATLRYGSQSIGGVVSATNNRIPDAIRPAATAPRARMRAAVKATAAGDGACATSSCAATASTTGSKAACCSMPRPATSRSMPMRSAARPTTIASRAIPYLFEPGAAVQRTAAELVRAHRRAIGRRVVHLQRGLRRRRGDAEQCALWHSGHRRRGSQDAHRRARDQVHQQGRVPPAWPAASMRCASGTASPTTSTTSSGLPIRSISSSDGVRQTFTNKEHEGRVEVQLLPFDLRFAHAHHRARHAGRAAGTDRAGRYPGAVQRPVRPERQPARRRLHLQRVQVLATGPRRRSPAASSMCGSTAPRRTFPPISCPTATRSFPRRAISEFTPKSISVGLIQNLAVGPRRQHHGAARRARAEAGRAVLARPA